jgi:hypothetical protein
MVSVTDDVSAAGGFDPEVVGRGRGGEGEETKPQEELS